MKIVSEKIKLPNGAAITIKDQKTTGSYQFDNKKGYLLGSSILQIIKMEVAVLGQSISSDVKTTTTSKITLKGNSSKPTDKKPSDKTSAVKKPAEKEEKSKSDKMSE